MVTNVVAHLALSSVGRVAQGPKALHDSTASPSIQIRLGIRNRIYLGSVSSTKAEKRRLPPFGRDQKSPIP